MVDEGGQDVPEYAIDDAALILVIVIQQWTWIGTDANTIFTKVGQRNEHGRGWLIGALCVQLGSTSCVQVCVEQDGPANNLISDVATRRNRR